MLKPRHSRALLLCALGVPWSASACSRITGVDWALIRDAEGQGGTTIAPQGGQQHGDGGMSNGDEGGQAGALEEGGAAGEPGSSPIGGSAGSGGVGGGAGTAMGGSGGSGAGTGGADAGGSGGDVGGTGGGSGGEIIIIGGASAIAEALVLYDGGTDAPSGDYGGRTGLDQRCLSAKTALGLPHARSLAFISVSPVDLIESFPEDHQVPRMSQIVSKTGVLLAATWAELVGNGVQPARLRASLIAAEVVPPNAKRWLSGSNRFGQYEFNLTCEGWTSSTYSTTVQARFGRVDGTDETWMSYLTVACNRGENHVLCLAYP